MTDDSTLQIHQFMPLSRANGPGMRCVLWVQGCSLGCPGCFNPATHPFAGGQRVSVHDLFQRIVDLADSIEGITVSGGEPLQQRRPVLALLQRVRQESPLTILLLTGYTWKEIQRMPDTATLATCVDVLIAGRYEASQHVARDLRGSVNKTIHFFTNRYTPADVSAVPPAEVIISPEGDVVMSGIEPTRWSRNVIKSR